MDPNYYPYSQVSYYDELQLQPGHHEFPFEFKIPIKCPSSFEDDNGHIRYEVKAVVEKSAESKQEKQATLTVIAERDLNVVPRYKDPVEVKFESTYYNGCCKLVGVSQIVVHLPQSAYCPGQTMKIDVDYCNQSNIEIKISFKIKKTTTFRASSKPDTRCDEEVIAKLVKGPLPASTARIFNFEMEIPQMKVYNLDACSFIDIDYALETKMIPSGCHMMTSTSDQLAIGTIPLRELDPNVPLTPLETNQMPGFEAPGHDNKDGATVPMVSPADGNHYPPMLSPYASAPEPSNPDIAEDKMPTPTGPEPR